MSRRRKLTDEERIAAVREYLEGKGSYHSIAKKRMLHDRASVATSTTNNKAACTFAQTALGYYIDYFLFFALST